MAFKFPFTNYHELNLTWVLDQLKKLFEESAENVTTIENYNGRLTAVETELPLVADTAQNASREAAAAASLAQQAKSTADTAQENALQAQATAGQVRQEAQAAQTAANAATQAAQQAQATAQNFDGRITQAENDAASALEASRSFENRVQSAITTANNASQTATNAQGIATRADQNAALALDTLNAQRSELERIGAEQVELITEETESGKTEIENYVQSVIDSIPADYTALSALVDKKAPVIINTASGSLASFDDGADAMKIQKLVVDIKPIQTGSGEPSPNNIRPISVLSGSNVIQTGKNILPNLGVSRTVSGVVFTVNEDGSINVNGTSSSSITYPILGSSGGSAQIQLKEGYKYTFKNCNVQINGSLAFASMDEVRTYTASKGDYISFAWLYVANNTFINKTYYPQIEIGDTDTEYNEYRSNQLSVSFPSTAGTVYGGTLTINPDRTGTLVVDWASKTFNGALEEGWSQYQTSAFFAGVAGKKTGYATSMCDKYKNINSPAWVSSLYGVYSDHPSSTIIYFRPPYEGFEFSTANWRTWLSNNPIQVIYNLAEPQIVQLTSENISGILSTLYGTNNIWADNGDVSVDYPADTKLYIDGKLAVLQATILENI